MEITTETGSPLPTVQVRLDNPHRAPTFGQSFRLESTSTLPMNLRGIVQSAELVENPPGGETIEMLVRAQGVGPSQPRRFVIPHELLVADTSLDPDLVKGLSFEAQIEEEAPGRWLAVSIRLASRMLRPED